MRLPAAWGASVTVSPVLSVRLAPACSASKICLARTGEQGKLPVYTGSCGDTDVVLTGTGIGPALADEAAERMLAGATYDRVIVSDQYS